LFRGVGCAGGPRLTGAAGLRSASVRRPGRASLSLRHCPMDSRWFDGLNTANARQRMRPLIDYRHLTITCEVVRAARHSAPLELSRSPANERAGVRWSKLVALVTIDRVRQRFCDEVFDLSDWESRKVCTQQGRRRSRGACLPAARARQPIRARGDDEVRGRSTCRAEVL